MTCFSTIVEKPGNRAALFCFPYAGSGPSVFTSWRNNILSQVNVYAYQSPGKEDRFSEPLAKDWAKITSEAIKNIVAAQHKIIILFGHSLGAIMAYEIAKKLQLAEMAPSTVFFSGCRMPGAKSRMPSISHLPDRDFIRDVMKFGGLPKAVLDEPEIMDIVTPILRNDFRLSETYRDSKPIKLKTNVIVLNGVNDPFIKQNDLCEWGSVASHKITIKQFKGGHFFLNTDQANVISYLNATMKRVLADS